MDRRLLSEVQVRRVGTLLILSGTLSLLLALVMLVQASLFSQIVQRVFLEHTALAGVAPLLVALASVIVMRGLIALCNTRLAVEMAVRVKTDVRQRLMTHHVQLGPAYTQNERSGALAITITEGVEALDAYFRDFLSALVGAVIIPVTMLIVVAPIDALTFFVLLITAPLIPLFMWLIGSAAGGLARRQFAQMRYLGAHFLDVMQGLVTLKLFNRSQAQTQSIPRITDQFRKATMRVLRVSFLTAFILEMLATLSIAIIAVEIGLRLLHGGIAYREALFLLVIAPEFYLPLRTLGMKFHAATSSQAAAHKIYSMLDRPLPTKARGTSTFIPELMDIRFKGVSFSYERGGARALCDVSLQIGAGQTVAVVGETGAGKSTLAHLLLGFATPDEGRITVNGLDLSSLNMDAWRACIAWVPQRPYLFGASIAENIKMGNPHTSDEQLIRAAQAAGAHEFISHLPAGYATLCGERGLRLSGGQAQRIAIARALLKDAPLLILDEPTRSLDADTEDAVWRAMQQLFAKRTVLTIAHRLNTVINADRIYVLKEGRVVDQGCHTELMARAGAYQSLWLAADRSGHGG